MAAAAGTERITLGIETSCDDTALALLEGERRIIGSVIASQIEDHAPFGGVVPELASRRHQEAITPLLRTLLKETNVDKTQIDLIAVTAGPGLMGALMVGVMTAKGLAQGWKKPLIGVNHLEGHLYAATLDYEELVPPFLCMIVSGGHTEIVLVKSFGDYELLGDTRDDAAGEAYDKASQLLGLGYPGGPAIERLAREGDASLFDLPTPLKQSKVVEFSFSGLKTALRTLVERCAKGESGAGVSLPVADLAASFQRAVTDVLIAKIKLAVKNTGVRRIALSGGVAANTALRTGLTDLGKSKNWQVYLPDRGRCTDNAVMIAAAGNAAYGRGERSSLSLRPDPSWYLWK